jgi:hypothetical protein
MSADNVSDDADSAETPEAVEETTRQVVPAKKAATSKKAATPKKAAAPARTSARLKAPEAATSESADTDAAMESV